MDKATTMRRISCECRNAKVKTWQQKRNFLHSQEPLSSTPPIASAMASDPR